METPAPDHHLGATMRARSTIPALLFTILAAAACDTAPSGILEPGAPTLLVVAPSAATIPGGASLQLDLTAQKEEGVTSGSPGVVWSTSNPRIASVALDGLVKGRDPGSVKITAWWNGVRGTSTVTVTESQTRPPKAGDGRLEN
jgi:Big-like domain-containing protein